MIKEISIIQQGENHKKSNTPCQDAYYSIHKESYVIAAVTDGLGSEQFSDVGSSIASRVTVEYCDKHYTPKMNVEDTQKVMINAFLHGWEAVKEQAVKDGNSIDQYDTTLSLVIYDGNSIYYGHSGDSGIIALGEDGYYKLITTQQRDNDGCVFPLCFSSHWEFGYEKGPFHSILLTTDGVLEEMVPPILNKDGGDCKFNIVLLEKIMNRTEDDDDTINELQNQLFEYFENYPSYALADDKTLVVLWNPDTKSCRVEEKYYSPIDWDKVYRQINDKIDSDYEKFKEDMNEEEVSVDKEKPILSAKKKLTKIRSFLWKYILSHILANNG